MTDDGILWLFVHVPKTGGTTLDGHFAKHLRFDETFVLLSGWGNKHRQRTGRLDFEERPREERAQVRVLGGRWVGYGHHRLVPGRTPRYLTIVRDPADHIVSRYHFDRSRGRTDLGFEAWYEADYRPDRSNFQTHFLAARAGHLAVRAGEGDQPNDPALDLLLAKAFLNRCWFVGVTAHLDEDLPHLFAAMGLPGDWRRYRVAGSGDTLADLPDHPMAGETVERVFTLDEAWRARLHADNPADLELVRYAEQLRRRAPWKTPDGME